MSLLTDGIAEMGLQCSRECVAGLDAYLCELELWNRRQDLVKAVGDQLVTKHLLDSLSGLPILSSLPHESIADVGSGAGFPGIPIALCLPDSRVSLIERSSKRASFLRNAVALLGLRGRVEVIEGELESIHEGFSIVTFRAFRDLPKFARALFGITRSGGAVVAFKGRRAIVEAELSRVGSLIESSEIHPVRVPGMDEERNIVVIRPKPELTSIR
ncbi:MAG TPA: 16S rRNA (guanine(527)-N(7))-methyltransferase RsmG [Spirochaetia bacterium]|nr:16S rRNA (guanine(527)-N(7))-methyltransferase RsmG [Spirochaetia bacterium]